MSRKTPKEFFEEIKEAGLSLTGGDTRCTARALLRGAARDFDANRDTSREEYFGEVLEIAALYFTAEHLARNGVTDVKAQKRRRG